MINRHASLLSGFFSVALGIVSVCSFVQPAVAEELTYRLEQFTGDNAAVDITLEDDENGVTITIDVDETVNRGDLNSFQLVIPAEAIENVGIAGVQWVNLKETGVTVNSEPAETSQFEAYSSVEGFNLNGGGSGNPCNNMVCNLSITLGSNGISRDDVNKAVVEIQGISASNIAAMSVRVTSVGDNTEGSSKIGGILDPALAASGQGSNAQQGTGTAHFAD